VKITNPAIRIILPVLAGLAFCTRYLTYTFPGADAARPLFNTTLLDHAASVLLVGLLLLAAMGLGSFVLRKMRVEPQAIWSTALGLGAISLAVLGLGLLGLMDLAFLALLAVLPALFGGDIADQLASIVQRTHAWFGRQTLPQAVIVLAIVFVFVLNLLRAFVPPLDYDVLEYHLGAPAHYVQEGRIRFLPGNVYAAFPANVEMLYLFALGIKGDLLRGAAMAGVIDAAMGLLVALGAGSIARRISLSPMAGVAAAAAVYVFPWVPWFSIRSYVELGMMLFAFGAIAAFLDFTASGKMRHVLLAGIFAGLCAGCKYTAIPFLVVPVCAAFFLAGWRSKGWKRAFGRAGLFGCTALLVLSPWLVKNAAATGNPAYPLLYRVFDGANWSHAQDAKWATAHVPKEFGPSSLLMQLRNFLNGPGGRGAAFLWIPVLISIAALPRRNRQGWLLVGFAVLSVGLWHFTTHRMDRFLAPWFMVVLIPAAANSARLIAWKPLAGYAAVIASLLLWTGYSVRDRYPIGELAMALGYVNEHAALEQFTEGSTFSYKAIRAINALPPGSKVLMVGEAQTFYCTTPFVMATVFDRNPLEAAMQPISMTSLGLMGTRGDAQRLRRVLAGDGITHIYVNVWETKRLRYSYAYESSWFTIGRDESGRRPGYLDLNPAEQKTLGFLLANECELVAEFGEGVPVEWVPEADRPLFAALTRGTVSAKGRECLPFTYAIYRLKQEAR